MTDMQPKKMISLDILNILRKHTDENDVKHRLSQQQIQWLLQGLEIEQKKAHHSVKMSMKDSCY